MRNGDVTPGLRGQLRKGSMPTGDVWAPGHRAQHWAMWLLGRCLQRSDRVDGGGDDSLCFHEPSI